MLINALIDGIEGASLGGEEEVGTIFVCELKVLLVSSEPFAPKLDRSGSILALAPACLSVLVNVDLGHHVVAQPGVHNEVAPTMII